MAYKTKDGKGPYPNKAGEFCSNHYPESPATRNWYSRETQEQADQHQRDWLANKRFGRPAKCQAGTSGEMAAKGYVGVYLDEDRDLHDGDVAVETDELTEAYVTQNLRE